MDGANIDGIIITAGEKFNKALNNCLVNFDKRVLVTDLLAEYNLQYRQANDILANYIGEQEKLGKKYEKRFLVSGKDYKNEVFTIAAGEEKLKEWLSKLSNAESSLYSVELAGGAKAPAQILKPMVKPVIFLECSKERIVSNPTDVRNVVDHKVESKISPTASKKNQISSAFNKKSTASTSAVKNKDATISDAFASTSIFAITSTATKSSTKTSPTDIKKKSTFEDKKSTQKQATTATKKGINSFFTPAKSTKTDNSFDNAKSKSNSKTPTPKKMDDFYKKQTDPTTLSKEIKANVNTSVQLFVEDADSSDEEEKLEALKREINFSDDDVPNQSSKRRRIEDSDDDEPQQKHEKADDETITISDSVEEDAPKSETFLDEDGFVMTVKPKKANVSKPAKKSPIVKKSPVKQAAASKSKSNQPPAKTKQGNIMNFFTKK